MFFYPVNLWGLPDDMKPELQNELRKAIGTLRRELDPDNTLRAELHKILTQEELDGVYVRIISIFT